ncbi:MAG: SDR family NAD(P)-dependent oxidoreductase [Phycisphaerales bacterium]|nr:SDR family NAD(P)-dependent oxidoreductase [Phycisphaerales bacterium]
MVVDDGRTPGPRPVALITGASTGIGAACAVALARKGWTVAAGVREASGTTAPDEPHVHPIELDVTVAADITTLDDRLTAVTGDRGLAALVNNAGIVVAGPVECVSPTRLREQLEVNVVGAVAVTQAVLPALRRGGGRIVNISSISGRVALPLLGPYAASKFALEALSDALRVELRDDAIPVTLIEPGSIATPIWEKSLRAARADQAGWSPAQRDRYGRKMRAALDRIESERGRGLDPACVARVVIDALTARRAPARRRVGVDARGLRMLDAILPVRLRDALLAAAGRRISGPGNPGDA